MYRQCPTVVAIRAGAMRRNLAPVIAIEKSALITAVDVQMVPVASIRKNDVMTEILRSLLTSILMVLTSCQCLRKRVI